MPVIANGWCVAMFGVVVGSLLLDVHIPRSAWPLMALVVAVGSLASTGLGLVMGAINLVYRDGATLGNVFFLVLLIFTGTNVALDDLPGLDGGRRSLPAADPRHRGDPDAGRRRDLGRGQRAGRHRAASSAWPTSPSGSSSIRLFERLSRTRRHARPDLSPRPSGSIRPAGARRP